VTAKELINAAGRLIGELRSGRTFSDAELADMLVSLNQMLGEWSEEQFGIFQIARDQLPLTGAPSYTMGTGGTLATTRPVRITSAATLTTGGSSMPTQVADAATWAARVYDDTEIGAFVELVFPDYGLPLITLRVWPRPATGSLILYSLKPLTAFAALTDTVTLPSGYEEGLIYGFACKIAPEFSKRPTEEVIAIADRARLAIGKTNAQLLLAVPAVA
jgi:hypothetical protein